MIEKIYISKYWTTLKKTGEFKRNTTTNMQNWETVFTYIGVIGGKLYSNHSKKLNHVHKDSKDMVSIIITVGKYISGGDTVFYYWVNTYDLGSRAHILNHLHGIMIFGPFGKKSMKVLFEVAIDPWFPLSSQNKSSYIYFAMGVDFITDI